MSATAISQIVVPAAMVATIREEAARPSNRGFCQLVHDVSDYFTIAPAAAVKVIHALGYPERFGLWFWEAP
jgi:hypothetical protein